MEQIIRMEQLNPSSIVRQYKPGGIKVVDRPM